MGLQWVEVKIFSYNNDNNNSEFYITLGNFQNVSHYFIWSSQHPCDLEEKKKKDNSYHFIDKEIQFQKV